jgi:hypothetical protein
MIEVKLPNGNILFLPENAPRREYTLCDCHIMMGNDFFFMPKGKCLRKDKTCNEMLSKGN